MIITLFDIIILVIGIYTIKNFNVGFFLTLLAKIVIPSVVRFKIGGFSLSNTDFFLLFLICSFIINRPYRNIKTPKAIKYFILINVISTFIFILFSSEIVPYSYQFNSFFKGYLFQTYLYILLGFYASQNIKIKQFNNTIIYTSLLCGIYGLFTYMIKQNPYIDSISLIYSGDISIFSFFIEEVRGGIEGRISGTMPHPLQWGQYWNILIGYLYLFRKQTNRYLWTITIILGIINIVLCGSRTAIITFIITTIFFLASFSFKALFKYLTISYISLIFITSFIPETNQTKGIVTYIQSALFFWDSSYSEKADIVGSSTNMRSNQLETAIDIMLQNPIGGVGYNYQYYVLEKNISTDLLGFESIVFKILVEQGILSLFLFLFTFNLLRLYIIRKQNLGKSDKWIINGYFVSFLASILFTGIQGNSWIFFLCLFFLYINNYNKRKNDSQNHPLLLAKQ